MPPAEKAADAVFPDEEEGESQDDEKFGETPDQQPDGPDEPLSCDICLQDSEALEKDLLPSRRELIRWRVTNFSKKLGCRARAGKECYPCWYILGKEHKGEDRKHVVKLLHAKTKSAQAKKAKFDQKRREFVRGETPRLQAKSSKASVEEVQQRVNTRIEEGHFYAVDDYLTLVRAPSMRPLKEKAEYLRKHHGKVVYTDARGTHGVDEVSLPAGASYKFQRGENDVLERRDKLIFEDDADADAAYEEAAQGEDDAADRRRDVSQSRSRSRTPPAQPDSGNSNRVSVKAERCEPPPLPPRPPSCGMSRRAFSPVSQKSSGRRSASVSVPPLPSAGSRDGDVKVERESLGQASNDDDAPERPAKKQKKIALTLLKSNDPAKIRGYVDTLMAESGQYTATYFWEGKYKSRDVENMITRLQTASGRVGEVLAECDDAAELAERLLTASEDIINTKQFVLDAKCKAVQVAGKATSDSKTVAVIKSLPSSLKIKVFLSMASAVTTKFKPGALHYGKQLLTFLSGGADSTLLTCRLLPESSRNASSQEMRPRDAVQAAGIANFINHMFSNFMTVADNLFTGKLAESRDWAAQCLADFSLIVVLCEVLAVKKKPAAQRNASLATAAIAVQKRRNEVSLKLRTSRGQHSPSHIGRACWDELQHFISTHEGTDVVAKRVAQAWATQYKARACPCLCPLNFWRRITILRLAVPVFVLCCDC